MYENGWNRFVKTGQVLDYLSYKGYPTTKNKTGNTGERVDAGLYHGDGNRHQSRTNRRI